MLRKYATRRTVAGVFALLCAATTARAQTAGTADSFAIVGGQAVNANGVGSTVNGNVGINPAAATNITGFPAAASIVPPYLNHGNDSLSVSASAASLTLFNSAVMAPAGGVPIAANLSTGGPTANGHYTPGKYFVTVGTTILPTTMTLDGGGTYIFTLNSDLTTSVGSTIILNGVNPCNVWWRVPTQATLNGASFPGTVVSNALIALGTGAVVTGRALTTANGAVTLAGSNSIGGCSAAPPVCPTITIAPPTTPNGTVGAAYTQTLTASGGTGPYTFSVASGALPAGITLSSGGLLSGTPTSGGSSTVTILATDNNGCPAVITYTINVAGPVAPGPGVPPCPPGGPRPPPTITSIANQVIPVNGSVSVDFTIGGSIITDALVVTATSSDTTLVPASAMVITKGAGGARTLTIRGADGRSGVATITVTVTDPSVGTCTLAGNTSFQFAIGVTAVPTLPEWAMIALMALLALAGYAAMRRRTA